MRRSNGKTINGESRERAGGGAKEETLTKGVVVTTDDAISIIAVVACVVALVACILAHYLAA